jgi:DNA-binding protein WhiA
MPFLERYGMITMSFSSKVKQELTRQIPKARHCRIAEFIAIFTHSGRVVFTGGGNCYLEIRTENLTVASKSDILVRNVFQAAVEVRVRNHNVQGNIREYFLLITRREDVVSILKAVKMMDDRGVMQENPLPCQSVLLQNTCCKRAFLRGAFLVAGSVTDPEKAYHLEIAVASSSFAAKLQELMSFFALDAKIVTRKKYQVVYLKEGSQIVDFLNVVEAHVALMEFENIRIVKDVRNTVNRQVNCETANIGKTVAAAAKQLEDIRYIEHNMGLRKLAVGLREIAELRLEYPDSSLQEL